MLNDENPDLNKFKAVGNSKNNILKSLKAQKSILVCKNPISEKIVKQRVNPDQGLDFYRL